MYKGSGLLGYSPRCGEGKENLSAGGGAALVDLWATTAFSHAPPGLTPRWVWLCPYGDGQGPPGQVDQVCPHHNKRREGIDQGPYETLTRSESPNGGIRAPMVLGKKVLLTDV